MRRIAVFIAGSTVLQEQRTSLKALATDLNGEFEKEGVNLQVFSYESLKDNQKSYNEFITENADLVMFIIDGIIGSKTQAEFDLAIESYSRKRRPKILVFIHKLKELTSSIAHLEGYVEAATGDYCITYNDNSDLVRQAEIRLRRFVSELPEKSSKSTPEAADASVPRGPKSRRSMTWALAAAIAAVVGLLCYIFVPRDNSESTLIIAGGGTAANHIDSVSNIQLRHYPDAFYMHMPSGAAWQLLTEEVISNAKNGKQCYEPVCVSASEANDSSFLSNIISAPAFIAEASVVSFNMGNDRLVVYAEPKPYIKNLLSKEISNGKITVEKLARIVGNNIDSVNILTTTPQSGTRKRFQQILSDYGANLSSGTSTYTEISDEAHLTRGGKPYLLLGTASYCPNFFIKAAPRPISLTVVDSSGNAIEKPVFLYCLAYVVRGNEMRFPRLTKKLLKDLRQDTIPIIDEILKAKTFKRRDDRKVIITPDQLCLKAAE